MSIWLRLFFCYCPGPHRGLPSFPTRRSSDLRRHRPRDRDRRGRRPAAGRRVAARARVGFVGDRKSTRLNSSHVSISYAVYCLKKKNITQDFPTRSTYHKRTSIFHVTALDNTV